MNPVHARVLIVSANRALRQQLRELITQLRVIQLDEACNALDAITLQHQNAPDLVVSDWDLPGVSGLELLREIRRSFSQRHTSVVLLSDQKNMVRRTIDALHAGTNGMLLFPLELGRARAKLERIIGGLPERSRGALRAADLWSPGDADRSAARGLA